MKLKDKIVFITGASAGIGEACARGFAAEEANLVLTARRIERLKTLSQELERIYNTHTFIGELDVRDNDKVDTFVESLPLDFQGINILLNNAGQRFNERVDFIVISNVQHVR